MTDHTLFQVDGRVVIDPKAFRRFRPNSQLNDRVRAVVSRTGLTEEEYMICNPVLLGFSLKKKKWGMFTATTKQSLRD